MGADTVRNDCGTYEVIMEKRPFIIDCDTGTDDAIAILAALGCEEIEIVGITCVNGNVPEETVAHNNLNLLEYVGAEIPVSRGAWLPLAGTRTANAEQSIHGKSGLGNIQLPEAEEHDFDPRIASKFLYEEAKKRNGELELLVTGPMTNIAITILEHPDFCDYIRHLYFMGGSAIGGNVNTSAEFNIWVDPEAVHTVLMSPIPCTMTGLDVTNLTVMTQREEEILRSYQTREGDLAADLLHYMMNRENPQLRKARMHDPLALASAVFPECMKYREYFTDTECRGTWTRGHTAADLFNRQDRAANVSVAMEVDFPAFRDWLLERIRLAGLRNMEEGTVV